MIPSKGTATPRQDLGVAVHETLTSAPTRGFVADLVYPYFFVAAQSSQFPVIPAESAFNVHDTKRDSKGNYNRVEEQFEDGWFQTTEHGLEMPIYDRYAAMYGGMFNYELSISNMLMGKILRAREVRVANKAFNASNYLTGNVTVGWANVGADPKADIQAKDEILRGKGIVSNRLILAWPTVVNLKKVTKVIEAVKDMFPDTAKNGTIDIRHLEAYLEKPIIVAGSQKNAAKKGKDASLADIWSDSYAMLARVAEGPDDDVIEPCIGRTFYWNEGVTDQVIVEEYYSNETRARMLRVRHDVAEQLLTSWDSDSAAVKSEISKNCGYLIGNIKAT